MVKRIQISAGILFAVFLIITGCESTREATLEEHNKELVRRMFEEVWNKGNHEIMDELFSADVVWHFLPDGSKTTSLEELRDHVRSHRKAFPDWAEKIKQIVAEGDLVATHFTSTGTNTGTFRGNPPTGKQIQINEMSIFRLADGKIVEQWLIPDLLSLNQQLGLISQSK
ncbi:MAG: ester cyclase [candidate division Zixibacteria bacterium]